MSDSSSSDAIYRRDFLHALSDLSDHAKEPHTNITSQSMVGWLVQWRVEHVPHIMLNKFILVSNVYCAEQLHRKSRQ